MRRLVDPKNPSKQAEGVVDDKKLPPSADIELVGLMDKAKLILFREIQNLLQESTVGLLSKDSSQALVNYTKLLKDLVKEENDLFGNMTDEELEKLLKSKL